MYLLFNILLMNLKHSANKAICEQFIWTGFLDFMHSCWLEIFNGYSNKIGQMIQKTKVTQLSFAFNMVLYAIIDLFGLAFILQFLFFFVYGKNKTLIIYLVNLFGICISLCFLISMFSVRSWNKSWCHANIIFRLEQYKQYINISQLLRGTIARRIRVKKTG